ncbi:MAG: trypsin-like peptidase domain-containing protein [bacterium]|nr:trypsin-like peptidase domain-containing protein [bacterium]
METTAYPHPPPEGSVETRPGRRRRREKVMGGLLALGLVISGTGLVTGLPRLWEESQRGKTRPTAPATPAPPAATSATSGVVVLEGDFEGLLSTGTGMILTESGEVLTAYHVVEGTSEMLALDPDSGETYELELRGYHYERDIALLQVVGEGGPFTTVAIDEDGIAVGDSATVLGNANGQGYLSEETGKVVALDDWTFVASTDGSPAQRASGLIRTDVPVVSGHSGGPMMDEEGEVTGVVVIGSTGPGADGYAVPIAEALQIVESIRGEADAEGVVAGPTASLGIVTTNSRASADDGSPLELQDVDGLQIVRFLEGSAAWRAGLRHGDVITSLDGEAVRYSITLARMLREREPKETVALGVMRADGTAEEIEVVLGERSVF